MRLFLACLLTIVIVSCSKEEIIPKCLDDNSLSDFSKYYSGLDENESVFFVNENNEKIEYIIQNKKYVIRSEKCGCSRLELFLSNSTDSIYFDYTNVNLEYYKGKVRTPAQISFKSKLNNSSSFMGDHSVADQTSFELGELMFDDVLILSNPSSINPMEETLRSVVIAKNHGIIQMTKYSGEVLTKMDLGNTGLSELSSFTMEEPACP